MEKLNVNPTRMELGRLRKRYNVARRGYRLLKDKRDGLVKEFLEIVRQNKEFRAEVEASLSAVYVNFSEAHKKLGEKRVRTALLLPNKVMKVSTDERNIMSVKVPTFTQDIYEQKGRYPYGFLGTSLQLDKSVDALSDMMPSLLRLAELEKTAQLLASEIERVRRRVNALEHRVIPQLEETIKYITMKLDENERGNLTRLLKVKEMIYIGKSKNSV